MDVGNDGRGAFNDKTADNPLTKTRGAAGHDRDFPLQTHWRNPFR
jgi:hypothetical protein